MGLESVSDSRVEQRNIGPRMSLRRQGVERSRYVKSPTTRPSLPDHSRRSIARAAFRSSLASAFLNRVIYSVSGMAALLRASIIGEGVGMPGWGLRLT